MDGANDSHSFRAIGLIVLEVDGVLTDGRAWPDASGQWRRRFSVRDSIALRAWRKAGAKVAVLTRSSSDDIHRHASLVGFDECIQACDDKAAALASLLQRWNIEPERAAAVIESDDDAWMAEELGCVVAVAGAGPAARKAAHYVTEAEGGDGAVREACNAIRIGLAKNSGAKAAGL